MNDYDKLPREPVSRDSEQYRMAYKKTIEILKNAGMEVLGGDTESIFYRQPDGDIVFLMINRIETFAPSMLCRACARVPNECYLAKKLPAKCKWFIAPENAICRKCGARFVPRSADDQMICLCDKHLAIFCGTDHWRLWQMNSRWKKDGDKRRFHEVVYDIVSKWLRETR